MTGPSVSLRRAGPDGIGRIERLLRANDLPDHDVREKADRFFLCVDDSEELVGVGGVETFGPDGLLRSVVVPQGKRGRGYGSALCDALEAHARQEGVRTLYLLTTTAAPFFRDRGYAEIDREVVPARVRANEEFTDFCSVSATCLRKGLT
ncbi:arsenic resistance N-acetyltransferase ArsN2 [Haloparvum sedimenti]|uniref:arsenic resistance N-acetyltransferase ArsN2 n=1 Tax=Haloparvum sedimenti TaxID=1678448 RepID=UPI00071E840A|nr:arsenic resistance N-acetyltransferase ArsN2 [Haloparvum sedimenti]